MKARAEPEAPRAGRQCLYRRIVNIQATSRGQPQDRAAHPFKSALCERLYCKFVCTRVIDIPCRPRLRPPCPKCGAPCTTTPHATVPRPEPLLPLCRGRLRSRRERGEPASCHGELGGAKAREGKVGGEGRRHLVHGRGPLDGACGAEAQPQNALSRGGRGPVGSAAAAPSAIADVATRPNSG